MTTIKHHAEIDEKKSSRGDNQQVLVDEYFETTSTYWEAIYNSTDLQSTIYKYRQAIALKLLDELGLPSQSKVLEIGSGAGVLTIAIARRGYRVTALDKVKAMKNLTEERAKSVGLSDYVNITLEDVHDLSFQNETFDVGIALGVLPWLHSPERAVREISRVLKQDGFLIVTVDNKWRLNHILDPRLNPVIAPLREFIKRIFVKLRLRDAKFIPSLPQMHSLGEIDSMFASLGLEKIDGFTLGFGPFTFFGKKILPDRWGKKVNRFLQYLTDHHFPGIRSTGSHYIIVAQRIVSKKNNSR
ncbi:MAG: class I SAM-dependent methyltransferase [Bacteroidota bacterium]